MNRFPVRGGLRWYKSIETQYNYRLDRYSPPFRVFLALISGEISHIIQLPLDHLHPTLVGHLSLHLSTCPIRHILWFSVSCGSLGTLFRGLLHINAARKVAIVYLMQWQQLFLRYFWVSFILVCSRSTSLSMELPGGSLQLRLQILELHVSYPRRSSSLDHLPSVP